MYHLLHTLLSDKKGGETFRLFEGWHFFYLALTASVIVILLIILKAQGENARQKTATIFLNAAFGLYLTDFFLMPLAYGEIDIEKLPFHACTAMCVMCFLSHRIEFLKPHQTSFVLLGFISNLVYLVYPAGVMWHAVHPLSYRVIQTLIFHALMTVYGCLMLVYESNQFNLKKRYRDLLVIVCMTAWALLGNYAYNGTSEGYSHCFNWFFVVRDPFYLFDENIAPFVMPFLNIVLFFTVETMVYLIMGAVKRIKRK